MTRPIQTPSYRFNIGEQVQIKESGETGPVVGRADYSFSENCYLVRYKAGDGRAVENWWNESALAGLRIDNAPEPPKWQPFKDEEK